jgi:hypothetical protein
MLETVLIAFGTAVIASAAVGLVSTWETRVRLRNLEADLADWEERLMRETKTRAARASVEARQGKLNPLDEALIRQHTGQVVEDERPWWDSMVKREH